MEQVTKRVFAGTQAIGSREELREDRAPVQEAREERAAIACVAQQPQREVKRRRARTGDDGVVRELGVIVDEKARVATMLVQLVDGLLWSSVVEANLREAPTWLEEEMVMAAVGYISEVQRRQRSAKEKRRPMG